MFSGFLRKEREKRGISQERLCRGVCAVSALSRYENGERIPDRLLMNTLIERLGKSSDKLVTMISCQEYAYFEWKSKVKETLRKKNIALVQELILRKEARDASVNLVLQEGGPVADEDTKEDRKATYDPFEEDCDEDD